MTSWHAPGTGSGAAGGIRTWTARGSGSRSLARCSIPGAGRGRSAGTSPGGCPCSCGSPGPRTGRARIDVAAVLLAPGPWPVIRNTPEALPPRARVEPGRPPIPVEPSPAEAGSIPASTRTGEKTMNDIHDWFRREGLTRPRDSRLLAGVVAGLGRRIGIDPWPARLLVLLLGIVLHAGLILPYVILWILMPVDETAPATVWPPEPPVSPTP